MIGADLAKQRPALPSQAATDRQRIWQRVRWLIDKSIFIALLAWLFYASDALIPLLMTGGENVDLDDGQRQTLQSITKIFLGLSIYLVLSNVRGMVELLLRNALLVVIMLLACISYVWSIDPEITLRRCIILISFALLACATVLQYELRDIVKLFFALSVVVAALSLYFIVFQPLLGMNPDGRGARGAFLHKNIFSEFLMVTFMAVIAAIRMRVVAGWLGYPLLLVHLALLIMANSATALTVVVVMLGILALVELGRLPFKAFATVTAFGIAIGLLVALLTIVHLEDLFLALDRDPTLTGRDAVWAYARSMIENRALLGHGYAAFWESEPIMSYVMETLNWRITHAHNGYLQVWIELGIIGLSLLILYLLQCLVRFVRLQPSHDLRAFVLPTLIGLLVYNLGETQLMVGKSFGWIMIMICLFLTTPGLERIKARNEGREPAFR